MKKLFFILLFCIFLLPSCQKEEIEDYCWRCEAVVYGKTVIDYVCDQNLTFIQEYMTRLSDFYDSGLSQIDCKMLPQE